MTMLDVPIQSQQMPQTMVDVSTQFQTTQMAQTTETPSYDEVMGKYWQHRLSEEIKKYSPSVIFTIGATVNLLCLCVLLRKKLRRQSTFAYLTGLTIADTVFLCCNPLRIWVEELEDYRRLREERWVCKTVNYFGYSSSHFGVWLLVMVTAERLIVVVDPLRGRVWCKRSRAYVAMAALFLVVVVMNIHIFWTYDLVTSTIGGNTTIEYLRCDNPEPYLEFGRDYWPWVDTGLYSILPFVLILTMNTIIIVKTFGAQKERRTLSANTRGCTVNNAGSSNTEDHKRLTVMLLTLTFTFMLLTTPITIFVIYVTAKEYSDKTIPYVKEAELNLAYEVCRSLMWANHVVNFFLYCITGRKFRREFLLMLKPRSKPDKSTPSCPV